MNVSAYDFKVYGCSKRNKVYNCKWLLCHLCGYILTISTNVTLTITYVYPADTDKTKCEDDLAVCSYTIPRNMDMIADYSVFVYVPSDNYVNVHNHYTCALSSDRSCDTFRQELVCTNSYCPPRLSSRGD